MSDAPRPITFETHPARYQHWKLTFDNAVATLAMDVREDGGLSPEYRLKLNSYDLGVDIELADAIQRIRFEHPEIRAVVITSAKERVFCAGANIVMLRESGHGAKVNFCKFTNETRLAMEDGSQYSGITFLAAVNGTCAGGGYELALACDEIILVDDGNSAVSLPEAPLLGVLPGTGGLTRLVDKRHVRRDLADFFSTLVEGVKGRRAVDWRLVDSVYPTSQFPNSVRQRAAEMAAASDRVAGAAGPGIFLEPLTPTVTDGGVTYTAVSMAFDRAKRTVELTVQAPSDPQPSAPDGIVAAGSQFWPLRAFRELDDALLRLRFNEPEIGTIIVRTEGEIDAMVAIDRTLAENQSHWLVREIILLMKRTLKRLDLTARSIFACIEPGSAFAGSLLELALAADRSYMLDDPEGENAVALTAMNGGLLPTSSGLSRLQIRFLDALDQPARLLDNLRLLRAVDAAEAGLITVAADEIDYEDEVRLAVEARAAFSPDVLTALEANLRFAGPESLETKIFGRLTAWQNWVFQRPNAVGAKGALQAYGHQGRPEFDWKRT
ncbi:MAG: benzoyl-CoA-dihydrodiol lyase [Blastocatellia bacterium]|nr:MAG: benzoyl-CoA-dihydrodiol lyase [Blastocatellia bacterium]